MKFKQARQKFKSYTDAEKEIDIDGDGIKADELDEALKNKQDIKKALKKVKGLTDKQAQIITTLPMPVITSIVNNLSMIVAQKEVKESPLVADDMGIVKSILDKIESDLHKLHIKKQFEKGWPMVQQLARMAGYKVTKSKQAKGRTFRYDIKK